MKRIKKKKSKVKLLFCLLVIAVVLFNVNRISVLWENFESGEMRGSQTETAVPISAEHHACASEASDGLYSPNAILIRLDDGCVLKSKRSEQKIYPASLTKMMTTIVAIENLPDLKEKIELSGSMFEILYQQDASMAGFLPDEKVRAIDLLYGAILPSGAECCIGLAEYIADSEEQFAEKMNEKANALGMENTHFVNSTGLHDPNHYTTVKDLSILLRYALKNDTFRSVFTAARYSVPPTNKHPDGLTFQSSLFKTVKNQTVKGGMLLGGKTGYTVQAGLCLASLAEKDGKEYVLITAGAKGNHQSEQYHMEDAFAVYNSLGKK